MTDHAVPSLPAPAVSFMRQKMAADDTLFRTRLAAVTCVVDVVVLAQDMLSLCAEVSAELPSLAPVKSLACRAGCDTCCRSIIKVRPIFAILAVIEADRIFPPEQFDILVQRLQAGTPFCPFLFDGACSIYQARPMVCRGYYSLDYQACAVGDYCEKSLGDQGAEAHAAHQFMVFLFALEKRMESIEADFGLEPGPIFLDSAARTLVTTLGATGRWLAGEAIFSEPVRSSLPYTRGPG